MTAKKILIDLDGTLINSSEGIYLAYKSACREEQIMPIEFEIFKLHIGPPIQKILKKIHPKETGQTIRRIEYYFREKYDTVYYDKYEWYPGIMRAIKINTKVNNTSISIVTNKPTNVAKKIVAKSGMNNYFKKIVGIDYRMQNNIGQVFTDKAASLGFTLQLIGCDAKESIYIGDTISDYESCRIKGINFIAVKYGFYNWKQNELTGIDTLTSPQDLARYLEHYEYR